MKKLICEMCGKEIKEDEQIAIFNSCGQDIITHMSADDNSYDCDYRYMIEECNPHFGSKKEYLKQ